MKASASNAITKKDTAGGQLGQFLGTITNIGPKFGFIESPDLESQGQSSKVFILADELKKYQAGHKVKFTAYIDSQGRLQGKDLKSGLKAGASSGQNELGQFLGKITK